MIPPVRIGIATPMANPTVEPELRALFPAAVNMLVTRSVAEGDSRTRLQAYFDQLPETLLSFGGLPLHAFGFACTASSYLLAPGREEQQCDALAQRFGYAIVTARAAIEAELLARGARRIAIASPYPPWISEACAAFWASRGFEVVATSTAGATLDDTRAIYALDPEAAANHFVRELGQPDADCLLLTGTGLPTAGVRDTLQSRVRLPVITSNESLASACWSAAQARLSAESAHEKSP